MILPLRPSFSPPLKFSGDTFPRFPQHRALSSIASLNKCLCLNNNNSRFSPETTELESEERFSVLASEIPWEEGSIWSTLGLYMFCLHIPLGYGGLSIVAYFLHQPVLDPQTKVLCLVVLEMVELAGTVVVLRNAAKPHRASIDFFKGCDSPKERSWIIASALALAFLLSFIFITSIALATLVGGSEVNNNNTNDEVRKIVLNDGVSRTACFALYCILAPVIEEIVYRRFLLTSLSSTMNWKKAVLISSGIFAGAHFSGEDFVQLFIVGCVLGSCYSWCGNLAAPLIVHSLYNAFTLLVPLFS